APSGNSKVTSPSPVEKSTSSGSNSSSHFVTRERQASARRRYSCWSMRATVARKASGQLSGRKRKGAACCAPTPRFSVQSDRLILAGWVEVFELDDLELLEAAAHARREQAEAFDVRHHARKERLPEHLHHRRVEDDVAHFLRIEIHD